MSPVLSHSDLKNFKISPNNRYLPVSDQTGISLHLCHRAGFSLTWMNLTLDFFLCYPWCSIFQLVECICCGNLVPYSRKIIVDPWTQILGLQGLWKMGKVIFKGLYNLDHSQIMTFYFGSERKALCWRPEGTKIYDVWIQVKKSKVLVRRHTFHHWERKGNWLPTLPWESSAYPLILGCYNFPTSHLDTGSSEWGPVAATPPMWKPQPHPWMTVTPEIEHSYSFLKGLSLVNTVKISIIFFLR